MQVTMNVNEIRIPESYARTPPKKRKLNEHMLYFIEHGSLKHDIVVTQKGMLVDGYCGYIVAVMFGIGMIQCEITTKRVCNSLDSKCRTVKNRQHKRQILYNRQGGKCALCDRQLQIDDYTSVGDYLTFDHILPVNRGGSNGLMNLQRLCKNCNYQKQDTYMEGYYDSK